MKKQSLLKLPSRILDPRIGLASLSNDSNTYKLSPFACKDIDAFRQYPDDPQQLRTAFAVDRDRILYSGAYRRYHGKTQVFSFSNLIDEEMTNRSLHTTYVSQIARTISKILGLNLELTEAIALGHDLGHTPFGHDGEKALSKLCIKHKIGYFHHNIESLHIVDFISRKGNGLNLTFQVRDGILSHDGEVHDSKLIPERKKTEDDLQEYIKSKKEGNEKQIMPSTLEGCVVRITDTIAYIGQDIEDAIRCGVLRRNDIPEDCKKYLGDKNSRIIDSLVRSVVLNSFEKDFISFDEETSYYLKKLKNFNYEKIYTDINIKKTNSKIEKCMEFLFEKYLNDIENKNIESNIFKQFLMNKTDKYLKSFTDAEKVRDFIATMTDRYFNEEVKEYLLPWK
ncbi:MAG: HD domain-containing protein [Candidatus Cloacimonetes bacterium]|nr:HD domain-containing protein [Candidatus Cloacimonadota bacterium]